MDNKLDYEARCLRVIEEVRELEARYQRIMRRAAILPVVVLVLACASTLVVSKFGMPGIEAAYKEQGLDIPLATRPFVALSHLLN